MLRFGFILTCLTFSLFSYSQTTEDSIKAVVNQLFNGMKSSDPQLVSSSFADSAVLQTITRNKEGGIVVRNEAVSDFAKAVAGMPKNAADERIVFETIKIDGPLAVVWTPYHFYYEGKFSHCGVNSFQLVKMKGGWKIQYLIDTRRRQGCSPQ